jgi:small-conductance mechanosensitive channel
MQLKGEHWQLFIITSNQGKKGMRKSLKSALCSALVVPGLGQVINDNLKKGGLILAGVFVLFVAGVVKLYQLIQAVMNAGETHGSESGPMTEALGRQDFSVLWLLAAAFVLLWLYSVVDAYLTGRKIDRKGEGDLS